MARNWDDFLQRDLTAMTFPRAFGVFLLNTMFFVASYKVTRRLLPVGRFGIRSVAETPVYHNFGPIGVLGAASFFLVGKFAIMQAHTQSTKLSNLHFINFIDTF